MPKFFTPEAVAAGLLPNREQFLEEIKKVREALLANRNIIYALLHGSVVGQFYTHRSDINLLVVAEEGKELMAEVGLGLLVTSAASRYIPLQCTVIGFEHARTGAHTLDETDLLFMERAVRDGVIRQQRDCQFRASLKGKDALIWYIVERLYTVQSDLIGWDFLSVERRLSLLGYLMRVVVQATKRVGVFIGYTFPEQTTYTVLKDVICQVGEEHRARLAAILALDEQYSVVLELYAGKQISEVQYIQKLEDCYRLRMLVPEFLRALLD